MKIRFTDGTEREAAPGTTLIDLLPPARDGRARVVGALVDNNVMGLDRPLMSDADVDWLLPSSRMGIRFIRRGLSFVLVKAARDLFPDVRLVILHSLSKGFFCELRRPEEEQGATLHALPPLRPEDVTRLEARMREIVEQRLPFRRQTLSRFEAMELFEERERHDLVRLIRYGDSDDVDVHWLEDEVDCFHGDLVPHTGYLGPFELRYYPPGFILRFPEDTSPDQLPAFVDTRKLGKVFYEFKQWSKVLEITDVGALNDVVAGGEIYDFIRVAEALQEKRCAQIADAIHAGREHYRIVLIAGPSASGKTTFAQRLSVQLRVNGLRPIPIGLDDYYVERELTPRDESGDYDYEAVEALDIALLNDHLQKLTWGEPVVLPRYNFKTGKREWRRKPLQLRRGELLVIEGIHALNERLTELIPKPNKYKVYISPLTQLNLDDHNRVPTTDTRLLRRLTRDIQFRGIDARSTLNRWRSVRRGEEKNIFPFQEEADVMFNSGLFYEIGVLKSIAQPLLLAVPQEAAEYPEAQRLLQLLRHFIVIGNEEIPPNSILREFIGATCFFRAE